MESNPRRALQLRGIGALVTRPVGRADALCALIEKHGGEAIAFPVIEIAPPDDDGALLSALRRLGEADLIIFVSVHAVRGVSEALRQHGLQIPSETRVAAVGPKTAAQCEQAGIHVDFVPRARIDSEGLLEELRGFEAAGKNILIFRGQSGRDLIKEVLKSRGATVRYVESYRRRVASSSVAPVAPLLERWRKNEIHLVVIGSAAVLDALLELLGPRNRALLEATPVFAYGERVAEYCRAAGLAGEIRAAKQPTDESIVAAILEWAAT